ncbi:uncharacterized protein [Nicotiana tomentosiformis]|uniref:uncharacterized protein n=1 Tax=Nicotiana tomentosiformis TaxID=4098 RepID=UPI00388CE04F
MLRACVTNFGGLWVPFLPLVEFAYNNNYQSSIQMAPYKVLYRRQCRSPVVWFKPGEARLLGTDLVQDALDKVKLIQYRLHTAQSRKKSYADQKVLDVSYMVGVKVLLKVSPIKGVMRFGKKGKKSPRYIRSFEALRGLERWLTSLPCHLVYRVCIQYSYFYAPEVCRRSVSCFGFQHSSVGW